MLTRPGAEVLRQTLQDILAEALSVGPAQFGNVQVLNLQQDALEIAVQHGFSAAFLEAFRRVQRTDGCACGRAWQQRRRISIGSVENDAAFQPYVAIARKAGFCAVQSTPILLGDGAAVGVLSTHFDYPRVPSFAEGVLLDHCAQRAARAIESFLARP